MTEADAIHPEREIGNGLSLRGMRSGDSDALHTFITDVFRYDDGSPDEVAGIWARELVRDGHPTTLPGDGVIVFETESGRIVGSCFLIRQTWSYAGIPVNVGRPELIGTDQEYRGRGLVGVMLDAVHAAGRARGEQMQTITGIPYFYRRFGYEPAIVNDACVRIPVQFVPDDGGDEVLFRKAGERDVPFITRMHQQAAARAEISVERDEAIWRYELTARDPRSDYWHQIDIIESPGGDPIGLLAYSPFLRDGSLDFTLAEIEDERQWSRIGPAMLTYGKGVGAAISEQAGEPFELIGIDWTPDHPITRLPGLPFSRSGPPFAWYMRIEDLAGFIRHIAPAIERRLAGSPLAGFSGEVLIARYPGGMRLAFEQGRLKAVGDLDRLSHRKADAAFPALTLLQLALGARSIAELEHAFPVEARIRREPARQLMETIFPKLPAGLWPVA